MSDWQQPNEQDWQTPTTDFSALWDDPTATWDHLVVSFDQSNTEDWSEPANADWFSNNP